MSEQASRERSRDRRVVLWTVIGVLVLFGGLYLAGYLFTSDRVPHGTTVAGVDIGGLRPAAAEDRLSAALAEAATRPVTVTADGSVSSIDPADAGLSIDIPASVAQAGGGRSWSPARIWDYLTGGDDLEVVVDVDQTELRSAVEAVAAEVDDPAREGAVLFRNGAVRTREPQPGRVLDREEATRAIVAAYPETEEPVELPVETAEPQITEADLSAALDEFANPAMAGPVVLRIGGKDVALRPEQFGPALAMENRGGELEPVLDEERLFAAIEPAMRRVELAPRNATVRLIDGRPRVVPGENGLTFDREQVAEEFLSLVARRGDRRRMVVDTKVERPEFTAKDARELRIREVVSEYTTYFPHADYRNVNLGRAAELVDGTVLKPGETFSLNDTVGERTAENGFTKGFIISDGVYKEDYGGGVSQVATTLFNAAFFAGLKDVEHKPHSFYIDRYPVGREATVAWGSVDLRFQNDTPHGVLIEAWIVPSTAYTQGEMHVRMWSTKHWDITAGVSERYDFTAPKTQYLSGEECVPNEGYGGFDVDVYRYFHRPGSDEVVRKETMHTTYMPSDTVVCQ